MILEVTWYDSIWSSLHHWVSHFMEESCPGELTNFLNTLHEPQMYMLNVCWFWIKSTLKQHSLNHTKLLHKDFLCLSPALSYYPTFYFLLPLNFFLRWTALLFSLSPNALLYPFLFINVFILLKLVLFKHYLIIMKFILPPVPCKTSWHN